MRLPMYISYLLLPLDPAKVLLDITASFFLLSCSTFLMHRRRSLLSPSPPLGFSDAMDEAPFGAASDQLFIA